MHHSSESIRRKFNRSAEGGYNQYAEVQRDMADWLAQSLDTVKLPCDEAASEWLEIGCGTGFLSEKLLSRPCASLTALDLSPGMLRQAEARVQAFYRYPNRERSRPRIRFLLADVETWAPSAEPLSYDIIASGACFQWLKRPRETLRSLGGLLRSGGWLAFTTFGPETFRELHESFEEAHRLSGLQSEHHGLTLKPADAWLTCLSEAGFIDMECERVVRRKTYPSVVDFLHAVKAVGAGASEANASNGLGRRRLFADMIRTYDSRFRQGDGVAVTYDLLLFRARSAFTGPS